MRKTKIVLSILTVVLIFVSRSVKAELNSNDFERLNKVFSAERISVMTEEEINKYLQYDLENVVTESAYYKGISQNNSSYTWTEVSKEEYDSNSDIAPYASYATTYKQIDLSAINVSGNMYSFYFRALWKYVPAVRSFDVIAYRFRNVAIIDGSQSGTQVYRKDGDSSYSHVTYSPNGTNISKQDQGFGISMNIVDDDIDYLELSIDADGLVSGTSPYAYASYQHATSNVTLAQSQMYNISAAGYGNVINFYPSVENKYDAMSGVYLKVT